MGLRTANSYLVEISYRLLQDIVETTITGNVAAGTQTIGVNSYLGLYVGAEVVISGGTNPDSVITILALNTSVTPATVTADFAYAYPANSILFGGTFPIQQGTDPLFTQSEILGYLARAQNEFLSKFPAIFAFATQQISLGVIYQASPATAIQIERVAVQTGIYPTFTLTSLSRMGNVVTATTASASNFTPGLEVIVEGAEDASFDGTFAIVTYDGSLTLTWAQTDGDATSSGGTIGPPVWTRLYETTQEQIALRDPQWFYNSVYPIPLAWFEDRTGLYQWGVAPVPGAGYPASVLYSERGPDSLELLDTLLVPDMLGYLIKYQALSYALSKDGEMRDPTAAKFYAQRFERGLLACDRYLRGMLEASLENAAATI